MTPGAVFRSLMKMTSFAVVNCENEISKVANVAPVGNPALSVLNKPFMTPVVVFGFPTLERMKAAPVMLLSPASNCCAIHLVVSVVEPDAFDDDAVELVSLELRT